MAAQTSHPAEPLVRIARRKAAPLSRKIAVRAAAMTAWRFVRKHEVLEAVDPFYIGVATGLIILILCRRRRNENIARITYR